MNKKESAIRCAELLTTNQYANIATCANHQPWNTPATAIPDSEFNFYWSSWVKAVHSENIVVNPNVFLTFYDSTRKRGTNNRQCLYLRCEAAVVSDSVEAQKAHELIYPNLELDIDAFLNSGVKRFYRARPIQAWLNILAESELQPDTLKMREEVSIEDIKLAL
ncbi:MAG: pyridoxamine 5'-phosphate oxidase family protein [Bacteroidota bacterium]